MSPIDEVGILLANTSGDAFQVVKDFHAASGADAALALKNIWDELNSRFGSSSKVASSLRKKIESFPLIKEGTKFGPQVRNLRDLCKCALACRPQYASTKFC